MIDISVRRRIGDFTLDAAFTGDAGITALFGRSGSGKTSIIDLIAGLARPDEGRVTVGGRVLFDSQAGIDLAPERRRVGYVFQEDRLFPHLSVRRNLAYGMARRMAGEDPIKFDQVVEMLGIGDLLQRRPHGLSGGEKQRVAIGRALLSNPLLLLMDEPLASLDAARKEEILPFIERLRDDLAMPVIYVSHAIDEIVRLADTVVLLSDGRVAATGPVEQVMSRFDLRPLTGRNEAGAVIAATVAEHDAAFELTYLDFAGGRLSVPHIDLAVGAAIRVRVRARDVSIALKPPEEISLLNVFRGRVTEIADEPGPQIDLMLDIGVPLRARITRKSLTQLDLAVGKPVYALIKAIAFDRGTLGRRAGRPR